MFAQSIASSPIRAHQDKDPLLGHPIIICGFANGVIVSGNKWLAPHMAQSQVQRGLNDVQWPAVKSCLCVFFFPAHSSHANLFAFVFPMLINL